MKRDKQNSIQWGRVLRRAAALFMATIAVWALLMTAGAGAALDVFRSLGENADFVSGALRAELGAVAVPDNALGLDGWGNLVLSQSVLLRSNQGAVASHLSQGGDGPSFQEDTGREPSGKDPLTPGNTHEDSDDPAQLPAVTTAPNDIVARTLIPTSSDGYAYADGVYIYNRTKLPVDAAALASAPVNITLGSQAEPQVLIMHTHATEAYTPDGTDVYQQTDNSRTLDENYNMCRIGDEMEKVFEDMGLSVLHDKSTYDYPAYQGAYGRSGEGVAKVLEQYPSVKIVLDVHRDALIGEDGTVYKTLTSIDGVPTAQVMLVLGSPEGGAHPNWYENLTLAMKLQKSMNTLYPTLARPITIRSSVYNQNLTTGSLLVEVGCHGNTLQEAIHGARLFARSAGQVLLGLEAADPGEGDA